MNQLKKIHAYTLRNGIDYNKTLVEKLLQIPNIPYAHSLFDLIPYPNVFLYNKLIQAYSYQNQPHQSLHLYYQMRFRNCTPNEHTFTFIFAACASFRSPLHAQILHTQFVKSGFKFDVFCLTALVDMYAKLGMFKLAHKVFDGKTVRDIPTWNALIAGYSRSGDMEGASKVFELMPERNVVSWTAMISGYSQNGQYAKALGMFLKMEKVRGLRPNQVTLASVLPACANLGALEVGERIEIYARENGLLRNLYVSNSLLEMYARCGKIDAARQVFDKIIGKRRNLCSWNSMIMGLAIHGRSNDAFHLYNEMIREGTAPDDVTIVGVLLACTHGGMVIKGRQIFESMENKFKIFPKLEHYGCMVDLLGRAGELREAYNLIKTMPMKPDSVIWGTLLGACSFYKNVEFAEIAAESLFKLEPWNPGNYVILSNIYASVGLWDGVANLRKLMKGGHITKAAGYSLIEGGGEIKKFIVEDSSHSRSDEIHTLLNEISAKIKQPINLDFFVHQLEFFD
ncbi:pentatricopeptide repeat-containing protein At5g08510 [Mercurialis annua]|uniref:pentatricopeptide repeat-containing protein At5g08510 n=1 Tax=Mercurialis annua TaxID=3986 RepID=UPI00215F79E7|nr:pentatricopeptide repeat-containing protein At5g08510 [Mercurialis annua]